MGNKNTKILLSICVVIAVLIAAYLGVSYFMRFEGTWRHAVAPGMWETLILQRNGHFQWIHCYGSTDAGKYHRERNGIFISPYGESGGWYFEILGEDAFKMGDDVYLKQ